MDICEAYGYMDMVLYVINDNSYPELADDIYHNLLGCPDN